MDELHNLLKIGLHESARRHRRRPDAQPRGVQSTDIAGHSVLVQGNVGHLTDGLAHSTVNTLVAQIHQQQVVVRAPTDNVVPQGEQSVLHGLGILQNLLLVLCELWGRRLFKGDSQCGDGVIVRATLKARKDCRVDLLSKIVLDLVALLVSPLYTLPVEDHGSTGAAQRLVGSGCHDVHVRKARWDHLACNQAGDMGHVAQQDSPDLVSNLPEFGVVNQARVSGRPADNQLGAIPHRKLLQLIVIDQTSIFIEPVGHRLEVLADHGDLLVGQLVPVAQVSAVGQIQRHNPVVNVQQTCVRREVGRGSRQHLNINTPLRRIQPKRVQSALLAQSFCLVNKLVAAIVATPRIPLGVLVGHHAADSLQNTPGCEVLAGNQHQGILQAQFLGLDNVADLRVNLCETCVDPHRICSDGAGGPPHAHEIARSTRGKHHG
mmetsp:Transcript_46919/g.101990  ORF Transcript_46919/g.101990 Transcript_46919/m.101990 type:complete len:433 (-) Transcript_46919:82-1380(-)